MSDLLLVRVFFSLTLMTIAINMVGWYGLWNYYRKRLGREKSGERDASKELKFSKIITPVIRLEFVYFLLLLLFQFLTDNPLSSFWVLFMFIYHFLGFLGNESYRRLYYYKGKFVVSKRVELILLCTIAALDLIEFFILITFSYRLYNLSIM